MASNAELPNLTEAMLKMGFSGEDIVKVLGGNFMRLFERVWKPALLGSNVPEAAY